MVMPGETITTGASSNCFVCSRKLVLKVCQSAAGFYIGTWCCEPHSRESVYYPTSEEAQKHLDNDTWERR